MAEVDASRPREDSVIELLSDSDAEEQAPQRGSPPGEVSGREAEESRGPQHASPFPVRRRRVLPLPTRADVVPGSPDDIVLVSSTVRPVRRAGGVKRPRQARLWQEPVKGPLIASPAAATAGGEPAGDVQAGPKCGICLEPMGGAAKRAMASGPCGHVYCADCLRLAVQTQRKCPTCRKPLQQRQVHNVFLQF